VSETSLNDAFIDAFQGGDWERARKLVLQRLGEADADISQGHGWLGIIAVAEGRPEVARGHLEQAVMSGELEDADPWAHLGDLVRPEDPERAVVLYRAAIERESKGWHQLALARCLEEDLFELEAAVAPLRAAAALESCAAEANARLVSVATRLGQAELANAAAEALMVLDDAPTGALGHAVASLADLPSGHAPALEPLAARFIRDHGPHLGIGVIRVDRALAAGELVQARDLAEHLRESFPAHPEPKLLLAEVMLRDADVAGAAGVLAGLEEVPIRLRLRLATATAGQDAFDDAMTIVEGVLAESPEHVEALLLGSRIALAQEDEETANGLLTRARALDAVIDEAAARAGRAVAAIVADLKDVWPDATVEHMERGHNAYVARIERGGETQFLKLYASWHRPAEAVDAEVELLNTLGGTCPGGLKVVVPRDTVEAAGWRGFSAAVLPGDMLPEAVMRGGLNPTRGASMGRALADLRAAFATVPQMWQRHLGGTMAMGAREVFHWSNLWEPDRGVPELLAALEVLDLADHPMVNELHANLTDVVGRLAALEPLPRGPIHGDFAPHNLLWDGEEVAAVLDFDYAAVDVELADLANSLARVGFNWTRLMVANDPNPRIETGRALAQAYFEARGPAPSAEVLRDLIVATRVSYCLNMARAGRTAHRYHSPDRYPAPEHAITVLARQVRYLTSDKGLAAVRAMLPQA